jgi:hypothetical protein
MENTIGYAPIELNEAELVAVSGGFSFGGFNVSSKKSNISNSFNDSGNTFIDFFNKIIIDLTINL